MQAGSSLRWSGPAWVAPPTPDGLASTSSLSLALKSLNTSASALICSAMEAGTGYMRAPKAAGLRSLVRAGALAIVIAAVVMVLVGPALELGATPDDRATTGRLLLGIGTGGDGRM